MSVICVCVCVCFLFRFSLLTQSAVLETAHRGISKMSLSFHFYCTTFLIAARTHAHIQKHKHTHTETHTHRSSLFVCPPQMQTHAQTAFQPTQIIATMASPRLLSCQPSPRPLTCVFSRGTLVLLKRAALKGGTRTTLNNFNRLII